MTNRMTLTEKCQRFFHQVRHFEVKQGLAFGRYTLSDYLLFLTVGIWFAAILQGFFSQEILFQMGGVVLVLLLAYHIALFLVSGGRGRVVDFV
ncbi:MAG: hypothetical protein Q8P05_04105 [Candidatus Diapherotrites archaeon]|nr:hypothetical protein [Candidatus Diapherotrites archaeon]MDZ4256420.1 hypothetical protein [archaeon]